MLLVRACSRLVANATEPGQCSSFITRSHSSKGKILRRKNKILKTKKKKKKFEKEKKKKETRDHNFRKLQLYYRQSIKKINDRKKKILIEINKMKIKTKREETQGRRTCDFSSPP